MLLAHTLAIKLSSVALVFLSSQLQIKMQKADNFLYFKNLKNSVFEILIFGVKNIGGEDVPQNIGTYHIIT